MPGGIKSLPIVCICILVIMEGCMFFFEDEDSGITWGLLKVLQDCRLIYWEIMAPIMV